MDYKIIPVGRAKDIRGQKFDRLTVLERVDGKSKIGTVFWLCECACGKKTIVNTNSLTRTSGGTKSCGCLHKETARNLNYSNIAGKKFGRLLAIEETEGRNASGSVRWRCRCDCGKEAYPDASSLLQGLTKSCGCLGAQNAAKTKAMSITGMQFHEFFVLKLIKYKPNRLSTYLCRCSCGKEVVLKRSQLGHKQSCGCKRTGENHHNWNPQLTEEERKQDRYTFAPRVKKWVKDIYRRDGWKCQLCGHKDSGKKGGGIVAHHINSFSGYEEEVTSLDNGITLCEGCHKTFHSEYGYGNNTKEQFWEFVNEYKEALTG